MKFDLFCAANVFCLTTCLSVAGCGEKDLSPPPLSLNPHDKIEVVLSLVGKGDVSKYKVNGQIEYGNMSKRCSNIHYFEGGWVDYPHGYVTIHDNNHAPDDKNRSLEIYRDYYRSNGECSWYLLGLGIDVYDENGRRADGGLPAKYLRAGYGGKLHCNFSNKWLGNCLPGAAGGIRTDLDVDISVR